MADEILLFDMARKGGNNCWSPNVWKSRPSPTSPALLYLRSLSARLVLNYKGLPYTTEWLTHPEIESKLKTLSVCTTPPMPHLP